MVARSQFLYLAKISLACTGFGLHNEEWEYIDYLRTVIAEHPLPKEGRQFLADVKLRLESSGVVHDAANACPGEVFTALVQSLNEVEYRSGDDEMRRGLANAEALAPRVPSAWIPDSQLAWSA